MLTYLVIFHYTYLSEDYYMDFYVVRRGVRQNTTGVYLTIDNWDDWSFKTTYSVKYVDIESNLIDIGIIKIAKKGMGSSSEIGSATHTLMPNEFESLDETFFSLGQDEDYYENLKKLDDIVSIEILEALNDAAYNLDIYEKYKDERVMSRSLLRGMSSHVVINQFNRMANGGAKLTEYNFAYRLPSRIEENNKRKETETPVYIEFKVEPESNPPSNIHIIIGGNGVGKTKLLKNILHTSLKQTDNEEDGYFYDLMLNEKASAHSLFANVVCVAFSAFDAFPSPNDKEDQIPYTYIGLNQKISDETNMSDYLTEKFIKSITNIFKSDSKRRLWEKTISTLSYDPYFEESKIAEINITVTNEKPNQVLLEKLFKRLSSGHKIILITLTSLIDHVVEKTLIILDEPETHLHPPLLSAFIRALSDILIVKNGVAIVATHSPILLQEVPASCAWKMQRSSLEVSLNNIQEETFGTNINSLMREVFGLESTKTGFHQLLEKALIKHQYDFNAINKDFNNELGDEARALLRVLIALHNKEQL